MQSLASRLRQSEFRLKFFKCYFHFLALTSADHIELCTYFVDFGLGLSDHLIGSGSSLKQVLEPGAGGRLVGGWRRLCREDLRCAASKIKG